MLTDIFGTSPELRWLIFSFLIPKRNIKTDIANYSGIARSTLYNFLEELEECSLVKKTKKVGNAELYMVNMDSEVTKPISAFQLSLAEIEIKKQLKNKEETNFEEDLESTEVSTSK